MRRPQLLLASVCVVVVAGSLGCSSRKSSLLLERHAVGPLSESAAVAQQTDWRLEPIEQQAIQSQIEVRVTFASREYLKGFFNNQAVFKELAGLNPYFPEQVVFYVNVANHSDKRIRINPAEFVLIDDRGSQYSSLDVDYVTALEEYSQPVATTTRNILEDARPGYFGLSLPLGKMMATKPQHRFALIKQSSLRAGYLYPGVVHDGLVAFWGPTPQAKALRLVIANLKTDFDANDFPRVAVDFPFTFTVANH